MTPREERPALSDSLSPARTWAVRIAFAVVVLILPVELVARSIWGEPYPALIQPAFAFSAAALPAPDSIPGTVVEVQVTFADTSTRTFTEAQLIPWSGGISRTNILTLGFIGRQPTADATAWLAARIEAAAPGSTPVSAEVVRYHIVTDAHTLTDSVREPIARGEVTFGEGQK